MLTVHEKKILIMALLTFFQRHAELVPDLAASVIDLAAKLGVSEEFEAAARYGAEAAEVPGAPFFCAVKSCKQRVKLPHLMCVTHWFLVPDEQRVEIWRAYKRYVQGELNADQIQELLKGAVQALERQEARKGGPPA